MPLLFLWLKIAQPKDKTWCQKCLDMLLLEKLFLWINEGRELRL